MPKIKLTKKEAKRLGKVLSAKGTGRSLANTVKHFLRREGWKREDFRSFSDRVESLSKQERREFIETLIEDNPFVEEGKR